MKIYSIQIFIRYSMRLIYPTYIPCCLLTPLYRNMQCVWYYYKYGYNVRNFTSLPLTLIFPFSLINILLRNGMCRVCGGVTPLDTIQCVSCMWNYYFHRVITVRFINNESNYMMLIQNLFYIFCQRYDIFTKVQLQVCMYKHKSHCVLQNFFTKRQGRKGLCDTSRGEFLNCTTDRCNVIAFLQRHVHQQQ